MLQSPVGAGLPAKRPLHSTSTLTDPPPSRASSLRSHNGHSAGHRLNAAPECRDKNPTPNPPPRTSHWEFLKKISMLRPTFAHRPAPRLRYAPTRQNTFSPSPTAGRKIRVYVLKAGAVYQK